MHAAGRTFVLAARVLWSDELHPVHDARLSVVDGKIDRLLDPDEAAPPQVPLMDCRHCTVMPGLIDTHCHLTLPGDGRDVDRYLLEAADEALLDVGEQNARRAVRGGVTTLRDLGARGDSGFKLVRRLERSSEPMPRLLVSGPVLTPPRGHGWTFGIPVRGPAAITAAVHDLAGRGANTIKVMASGGSTPGTSTWRAAFSVEELRAAVASAHRLGLPVAAHVSCPEAAERCLDAGVDDLEHLNLWVDEAYTNRPTTGLLRRIARQKVFVGPTLQTAYRILHDRSSAHDPRRAVRARLYRDVLDNARWFIRERLRLIAGSDAGFLITRFDELRLGLRLLIEQGLSERDALRTATVEAAAALGLHGTIGSLRPGADADLLIVEGDPLSSVNALGAVRAVVVRGRPVVVNGIEPFA